jgi:hypothetical protein
MPTEGSTPMPAVALLLKLLAEESTGDTRAVPASLLNDYGSSEQDRRNIAAATMIWLGRDDQGSHQFANWAVRYNNDKKRFVIRAPR